MKHLILSSAITLASLSASATGFDILPGLWEINTEIAINGKNVDAQAQLKKALAAMSPDQQTQMRKALEKSGANIGLSDKGLTVCYTKEMLQNPDKLGVSKDCKMKMTTQTPKKVVGNFSCESHTTSGSYEWIAHSNKSFSGKMVGKDAKNRPTNITYNGKFVSADCGNVKPIL